MGFLKADSGQILIDGVDVTHFTERQFEETRRKVTMVFQSGALFDSLSVAEKYRVSIGGPAGADRRRRGRLRRKTCAHAGSGGSPRQAAPANFRQE